MPPATDALTPAGLDPRRLAATMRALANPVRIELLQALRTARPLGEIRLSAQRRDAAGTPGRPMNRVTIRQHLDLLLELGMARAVRRVRDGRALDHYVLNQPQVFALVEELRQLVLLRPEEEFADGTMPGPPPPALAAPGAKLALVNGPDLLSFPLAGGDRWTIGRRAGCAVRLGHDPFVSLENAEVARERGGRFTVRDLGSRNGTSVDGQRLAPGEGRALAAGDLVGVGRSVLVFRP